MADLTWSDVTKIAPELASVDAALRTLFLDLVNDELSADAWGGDDSSAYHLARCYLAAHYASGIGSGSDSAVGEVASETMGGLTRSYVTSTSGRGGDLESTNYGRQYKQLARLYVPRGPVHCT